MTRSCVPDNATAAGVLVEPSDVEGQQWLPPIGEVTDTELASNVNCRGVALKTLVQWQSDGPDDVFSHQALLSEHWNTRYSGDFVFKPGSGWDARSPVLHPALTGLGATDAGFDEACLRALGALDHLFSGRRGDMHASTRAMLLRCVKGQLRPAAFLLRGAVMWACAQLEDGDRLGKRCWAVSGDTAAPIRLSDMEGLNAICHEVPCEANDVVYLRLDSPEEAYMLDVCLALCSDHMPLEVAETGIQALWPPMSRARVAYSADFWVGAFGGAISAADIWDAMDRFCSIWDCHDLWLDVLQTVQSLLLRPAGTGLLAGCSTIAVHWPASDMRVGVIGPLTAGTAPEGAQTAPIKEPPLDAYLYGAAVKGCMLSASAFEGIRRLHPAHLVSLAVGRADPALLNPMLSVTGARRFMENVVRAYLVEIGWDFMCHGIRSLGFFQSRHLLHLAADHTKIPWITQVVRHMTPSGVGRVGGWLRPSRPSSLPVPGKWYLFDHVGVVAPGHIYTALHWLGASVKYRVETPGLHVQAVDVTLPPPTRYPPIITPEYRASRLHAQVALRFTASGLDNLQLCEKLSKCTVHLLPVVDDQLWVGPAQPTPSSSSWYQAMVSSTRGPLRGAAPAFDHQVARTPAARASDSSATTGTFLAAVDQLQAAGFHLDADTYEQLRASSGRPGASSGAIQQAVHGLARTDVIESLFSVRRDQRAEACRNMMVVTRALASQGAGGGVKGNAMLRLHDKFLGAMQALGTDPLPTAEELVGAMQALGTGPLPTAEEFGSASSDVVVVASQEQTQQQSSALSHGRAPRSHPEGAARGDGPSSPGDVEWAL
jgi:hypothetical protein